MNSNKGSALVVTIIISMVLLIAIAGLLNLSLNEYRGSFKSYFNTASFHLAESGIDFAAKAITSGDFNTAKELPEDGIVDNVTSPVWYKKTSGDSVLYYRGCFPSINLEYGRVGKFYVLCYPTSSNTYNVYSCGEAGNIHTKSQRAINVELAPSTNKSVGTGAAIIAKDGMSIGSGSNENPFDVSRESYIRVASYDSSDGIPNMIVDMKTGYVTGNNYGDDIMIGVSNPNGVTELHSAVVYGNVVSGGDASRIKLIGNTKYNTSSCVSGNPYACTVVNLQAATEYYKSTASGAAHTGYNVSGDGTVGDNVKGGHKFEESMFDMPDFDSSGSFKTEGYTKYQASYDSYGMNLVSQDNANISKKKIYVGPSSYTAGAGTKSYTAMNNVNDMEEVVVRGNVVMVVKNTLNNANLKLSFVDDQSSLTLVLGDSNTSSGIYTIKTQNAINNISDIDNLQGVNTNIPGTSYEPSRFKIESAGNPTVWYRIGNDSVGAAVIRMPNGNVNIDCQSTANRNQFRGQLIAGNVNISGNTCLDFFYDTQLDGGSKSDGGLSLLSWKQVLPSTVMNKM